MEYISIAAVTATYGFALTASPFFKRQKGTKRLCPTTRCLARARHALTPALLRGSPRWAIHGPARLNRHPCRFTHCAEPPLGLSRGQENQKPKQQQKRGGLTADLIAALSAIPLWERGVSAKVRSAVRPPRFVFDLGAPLNHDGRTQALRSG
ncbi:hypothetical protein F6476_17625 [Pseudomonas umsongensis]|nr:hypothetical protein F6476_17625 [Pseudomonas umsongensis]